MSRHFPRLIAIVPIFFCALITLGVSSVCSSGCTQSPSKEPDALTRLSQGAFREEQLVFHPTEARLLALRLLPEEGKNINNNDQLFERSIVEIDYSRPDEPETERLSALDGGSFPSYAANHGIVALDRAGNLVFLPKGRDKAQAIALKELPSKPTKPCASPDGRHIAFMAIPMPDLDQPPDLKSLGAFRHEAYVVPLQGGTPELIPPGSDPASHLISIGWADGEHLLLHYQLLDERGNRFLRVEQVDLKTHERRLVLFIDSPGDLSIPADASLFVTIPPDEQGRAGNILSFYTRSMDRHEDVELSGSAVEVWLHPKGRLAAASFHDAETGGTNLMLLPVPEMKAHAQLADKTKSKQGNVN